MLSHCSTLMFAMNEVLHKTILLFIQTYHNVSKTFDSIPLLKHLILYFILLAMYARLDLRLNLKPNMVCLLLNINEMMIHR